MKVGFTGTQRGMSDYQRAQLSALLVALKVTTLHHGDCIGADAEAHDIVRAVGARVVLHPPDVDSKRAFCEAHESREPLPYLERNHAIVDSAYLVVAAPNDYEVLRSGTWATVRYARANDVPVIVLSREPADDEAVGYDAWEDWYENAEGNESIADYTARKARRD